MARASTIKAKPRDISRVSGNVFADLNFPDAEERQTKLRLAFALNPILAMPTGLADARLSLELSEPIRHLRRFVERTGRAID